MVTQRQLHLEVLGSRFRIGSGDENVLELVRRLWDPFLVARPSSKALRVTIERGSRGWLVHPEGEPRAEKDLWNALILVRNWIVERSLDRAEHFVSLHAAVVVRAGQAILVVGDPWAGKTTLTLRLVEHDWSYFSDDVAPIRLRDGRVSPFPKPIGIKQQSWEEMKRYWEPLPAWLPAPADSFLLPAASLLAPPTMTAAVGFLVFLRFEPARKQRMRTLSSAEALALSGRHVRGLLPEHLPHLSRMCSQARSVELAYRSAAEAADAVLELAQVSRQGPAPPIARTRVAEDVPRPT